MIILEQEKNKVIELIQWGQQRLRPCWAKTSRQEAEMLLSFLLRCERIDLYLKRDLIVKPAIFLKFQELIQQRCIGWPLQYLIREAYFFGLRFLVKKGIFIPRPETEILVELIISLKKTYLPKSIFILELCTGCGNIAISLTKNIRDCKIVATDINRGALTLAARNARLHQVENRIFFYQSDLFSNLKSKPSIPERFDIIIANPPYIARHELKQLPREVHYEPQDALDGGRDGLNFYREIISGSEMFLAKGGFLAFEFGDNQHQQISELLCNSNSFKRFELKTDLNGIYRFVIARKENG